LTTAPAAVAACTPIWWFDSKEVNPGKQDSIYPPPSLGCAAAVYDRAEPVQPYPLR
jgi:hypothetical protein